LVERSTAVFKKTLIVLPPHGLGRVIQRVWSTLNGHPKEAELNSPIHRLCENLRIHFRNWSVTALSHMHDRLLHQGNKVKPQTAFRVAIEALVPST